MHGTSIAILIMDYIAKYILYRTKNTVKLYKILQNCTILYSKYLMSYIIYREILLLFILDSLYFNPFRSVLEYIFIRNKSAFL